MHYPSILICPYCNRMNDCTTSADPEFNGPQPGDYAVCWRCAEVSRMDDAGRALRPLLLDEKADVEQDEELQKYRWHVLTSGTPSEAIRRIRR